MEALLEDLKSALDSIVDFGDNREVKERSSSHRDRTKSELEYEIPRKGCLTKTRASSKIQDEAVWEPQGRTMSDTPSRKGKDMPPEGLTQEVIFACDASKTSRGDSNVNSSLAQPEDAPMQRSKGKHLQGQYQEPLPQRKSSTLRSMSQGRFGAHRNADTQGQASESGG